MNVRKMVFGISAGMLFMIGTSACLWAGEPGNLILETVDKGLVILKDESLQGEEKLEVRKQRLWEELSPIFNFEEMSKRALGRYWRERSPEEKEEFVRLFTDILKESYIGKTDSYSGETIALIKERQEDRYAKVQTKFILSGGKEASVDFRLLNNSGKWTIYDVVIEGVSLVNNYRSQFNSILLKSSYADLLEMMKEKTEKKKT
ncbi:MAG: ABC transporter substrate-binding protein [Candidatus Brocadiaceae bacterium]|nr:ABC transporter substrate-binding protein [Candidatus Brocadiaceae bacterium]